MKVNNIFQYDGFDKFDLSKYEAIFLGVALDPRGRCLRKLVEKNDCKVLDVEYDELRTKIIIDTVDMDFLSFKSFLLMYENSEVLLDGTTLGFPEILFILNVISKFEICIKVSILYIEPADYSKKKEDEDFKSVEDYELSDRLSRISSIPPHIVRLDSTTEKAKLIAFMGFEPNRLGQIISQDDGNSYGKYLPVVGLPAYKVEWVKTSCKQNMRILKDINCSKLSFVPADNPFSTYNYLNEVCASDDIYILAPLGTKPTAIGCAIFLASNLKPGLSRERYNKKIGVVYDFPKKRKERTVGLGKINLYQVGL